MHQVRTQDTSNATNTSPFLDYIDSIIKELVKASTTILPEQTDLVECISNTQTLQKFIQHCFAKNAALQLDVLQAVIKIDGELYSDLLRPALLRRLQLAAFNLNTDIS